MEKKVDFSSFGKPFQEKLVQLIIDEPSFANQVGEVLDFNFFELKYLQVFSKMIYEYRDQYGKYPSRASLESLLRTQISQENEVTQKQMRDFYVRVVSDSLKPIDSEYVVDKSLDFCKKQKLRSAMLQSVELLETARFEEIGKVLNNALNLGTSNELGYKYEEDFEQRYKQKNRNPIQTSWKVINDLTQGGLGAGDLGVVIAPTGAGKSMVLTTIGAEALRQGKKVVHYTLELSDETIGLRYDSCLTGIPLDSLRALKDQVEQEIQQISGKLIIREYPTKSATTETIKAHLERLKQNEFKPDLVIVDYGDLLKPCRYGKEKHNDLESIYEELRGLAKVFSCPFWTASQTNRSGLNAEVITMDSISQAFSKCFVADLIFSCSRTVLDRKTNSGRFFVAKNRYGPDGIVCPIHMDTRKVHIEVYEPDGQTIQEIEKAAAKLQEERLKEKYKEHKNKN